MQQQRCPTKVTSQVPSALCNACLLLAQCPFVHSTEESHQIPWRPKRNPDTAPGWCWPVALLKCTLRPLLTHQCEGSCIAAGFNQSELSRGICGQAGTYDVGHLNIPSRQHIFFLFIVPFVCLSFICAYELVYVYVLHCGVFGN